MIGSLARLAVAGVLLLTVAPRDVVAAPAPPQLRQMLDEAERLRKSDKPRALQIVAEVNRALAADREPRLIARARLLECMCATTPEPALRAVAAGLDAAAAAHDDVLRARLVECRGVVHQSTEHLADAERDYLDAARLAAAAHDAKTEGEAAAAAGFLQYDRGAMAEALANYETAYRQAEAVGDEKGRLEVLSLIANVYADSHVAQYDKAIEYYKQLLAAYERLGSQNDIGDTLFNLGATSETKGDLAAAEVYDRRALAVSERVGKAPDIALCKRSLGSCLTKLGRPKEALPLLDAAVAYFDAAKTADNEAAAAHQHRGIAERRVGRTAAALADLQIARTYYERQKNTRYLERNLAETALTFAAANDWRGAYDAEARHGQLQVQLAEQRRDELSSRLRVAFDTSKKEQENRALMRENALRTAALAAANRERQWQRVTIALTALLAVALAVLFWRQVANTRRMRAMAMTDELTRLPNRRHILAVAFNTFAEAERLHKAMSVVALDIDHFKRINDTWGHAAGDEVLKNVARACRMALRPSDVIGRSGGEEFLVVLPETTAQQAVDVAERLRAAVERLSFSSLEPGLHVTISLGVQSSGGQRSVDALIQEADELLYRAKTGGRNRVASAA